MTSRMNDNLMKALLFIVVMVVMLFQSVLTNAQTYRGFTVAFGSSTYNVNTDVSALQQLQTTQLGGDVGFIFGSENIRTSLFGGYHSSTASTPGTIDRYSMGASMNLYPLSWIMTQPARLRPFISGGLSYQSFRFHGYYINREPGITNYSHAEAPYLGSIQHVYALVGGGLEFSLLEEYDFIHIYSNVHYGKSLSLTSSDNAFAGTSLQNKVQINVGVAFGLHR